MKYNVSQYNQDAETFLFDSIVGDVWSCSYGYKVGNGVSMRIKNHYSNPLRFQNDIDNGLIIVDIILPESSSVSRNNDFYTDIEEMGGIGFQYEVSDGEDLSEVVYKIQQFISNSKQSI